DQQGSRLGARHFREDHQGPPRPGGREDEGAVPSGPGPDGGAAGNSGGCAPRRGDCIGPKTNVRVPGCPDRVAGAMASSRARRSLVAAFAGSLILAAGAAELRAEPGLDPEAEQQATPVVVDGLTLFSVHARISLAGPE